MEPGLAKKKLWAKFVDSSFKGFRLDITAKDFSLTLIDSKTFSSKKHSIQCKSFKERYDIQHNDT